MKFPLEEKQDLGEGGGHGEVHQGDGRPHRQQPVDARSRLEEDRLDEVLAHPEEIEGANGREEGRVLDDHSKFIAERRQAQPQGLRQDDVVHGLGGAHSESLSGLDLTSRHRLKSRPEDFRLIRGRMEREGHRRNVPSEILPGEAGLKESGPENRCIDHDDDGRNSTEEIDVDRDGPGKGPESGDPQPAKEETKDRAEGKDDGDKAKGRANSSFKTTSVSSPEFRVEEAEIEEDLEEDEENRRSDHGFDDTNQGSSSDNRVAPHIRHRRFSGGHSGSSLVPHERE